MVPVYRPTTKKRECTRLGAGWLNVFHNTHQTGHGDNNLVPIVRNFTGQTGGFVFYPPEIPDIAFATGQHSKRPEFYRLLLVQFFNSQGGPRPKTLHRETADSIPAIIQASSRSSLLK